MRRKPKCANGGRRPARPRQDVNFPMRSSGYGTARAMPSKRSGESHDLTMGKCLIDQGECSLMRGPVSHAPTSATLLALASRRQRLTLTGFHHPPALQRNQQVEEWSHIETPPLSEEKMPQAAWRVPSMAKGDLR